MRTAVVLPAPVRAEQAEHGAGLGLEVDFAERDDVAVALAQSLRLDRHAPGTASTLPNPRSTHRYAAPVGPQRVRVEKHESELGSWELHLREPTQRLRHHGATAATSRTERGPSGGRSCRPATSS